jgi:two-component sensor histidine kinase
MMASVSVVIIRMMYSQYQHFNKRMEERRIAEESMKLAIREKETLLAEVHHRVKNNLAVISSLLNLQMNTVNNDYTRNVLRESRNRVASMALIHQKLYQHTNVEQIDFGSYASELVQEIKRSYPENTTGNISIHLEAEHIPVSLTKAVPAGLMLNELLSNCYKHAFHGRNAGNIFIRFKKPGGQCMLEVEDDGIGLSGDFKIEKQESLGMTIIQSLAAQIDAGISIEGNKGCGTRIQAVFEG